MSIPLDRLYHYIENIAQEIYSDRILIYRFWPHGSKNINDLNTLYDTFTWSDKIIYPKLWCNDQEPLNHEFYKTHVRPIGDTKWKSILTSVDQFRAPTNLHYDFSSLFKKGLLLHSEKQSNNLKKYQDDNELIPVYYWSHALIALDWFRFAKHETFQKSTKKTFLIYNRAWSGTREYRLFFSDLLIERNLIDQCQTSCNPVDPELNIHYTNHTFTNPQWKPKNILENFLQPTTADSTSSADFDTKDYNSTDIEVVLETLFDDDRLHLTEKSLRPIACGQPFILAGTHGSLEYLRSYGFQTFSDIWDESYDLIEDPKERLICIADLMKKIANWDTETRFNKITQARSIANYNQQWVFSEEFSNLVINELKTNLKSAFTELELCDNYTGWITRWKELMTYPEVVKFFESNQDLTFPTKESVERVMNLAKSWLAEKNLP
jgi:hypothetical protein